MDKHQLTEKDEFEVKHEKLVEMTQLFLYYYISEHIVEGLIDVLVPQIREQRVEIVNVIIQKVFETAHRRTGCHRCKVLGS